MTDETPRLPSSRPKVWPLPLLDAVGLIVLGTALPLLGLGYVILPVAFLWGIRYGWVVTNSDEGGGCMTITLAGTLLSSGFVAASAWYGSVQLMEEREWGYLFGLSCVLVAAAVVTLFIALGGFVGHVIARRQRASE